MGRMPTSQLNRSRVLLAWAVHLFTMTGVVWACLAAVALFEGEIAMMWLWLGIALVVDGVDGTMARKVDVKTYAAGFDGTALDVLIDYLTWTFIPALFMYLYLPFGSIPAAAGIIIGVGDVKLPFGETFEMGGIALGTIVTIGVYHIARVIAPERLRREADGAGLVYDAPGIYKDDLDDER